MKGGGVQGSGQVSAMTDPPCWAAGLGPRSGHLGPFIAVARDMAVRTCSESKWRI